MLNYNFKKSDLKFSKKVPQKEYKWPVNDHKK